MGPLAGEGGGDGNSIHASRFGVIPKPHQPGSWRLIMDLLHPKGFSINDGVDPTLYSLRYASIDGAASSVLSLGRGAELAKLDIASVYRIIPIHPDDCPLLGMRWKGSGYGTAVWAAISLRCLLQLLTAWNGSCNTVEGAIQSTTWMIICLWDPQAQANVGHLYS